jgi:cytoskeletal protein CcmA (bactofilin family)
MHMPTSQEVKEAFAEIDDNVSLLPPAPTLPPVIEGATENDPTSAEANDVRLSAETKILTMVIEKIPEGCLLTFSAGELAVLFSEPWRKRRTNRWYGVSRAEPVVPATEAYAKIERVAEAHQCSMSFAAGTVTFTKETRERKMFKESKNKFENVLLAAEKGWRAWFVVRATSDSTVENDQMPSSQQPLQRRTAMHSEEPALTHRTSSINPGVTVVGKIFGEGTVQIFGHIDGEVCASNVLIKEGAQVEGAVVAEELTIAGHVKGTIHANRVKLESTAVVEGDIFHRFISMEENARFEGLSKRDDNAGDVLRSRLSRWSPQDDHQTNVTPIDAVDRVQRALNVVAALEGGSRGAAGSGLRVSSGRDNRGAAISGSLSLGA